MTTIKTSELTGAALDWAVATAEKLPLRLDPMGFRRDSPDALQAGWWVWFGTPFSMILGYTPKSNKDQRGYSPSTDWAQGGPIIEREALTVKMRHPNPRLWVSYNGWNHDPGFSASGPTALIAAMRCYVASKLGDEVEVPEELL